MATVKEKPVIEAPEEPGTLVMTSKAGRTVVKVDMEDDGSFRLVADRDGRRVHDFSMNYEQPGPEGEPKAAVN